jgi:hypothetical protein
MRICPAADRDILYAICDGRLPGAASCSVLVHSVQAAGSEGGVGGVTALQNITRMHVAPGRERLRVRDAKVTPRANAQQNGKNLSVRLR